MQNPQFPISNLQSPISQRHRGFTLVELMVVVLIITILMSILIPTVSAVRQSAYGASTQAELAQIQNALERYYQDFHAYPGPISNADIRSATCTVGTVAPWPGAYQTGFNNAKITGSENLVLGLVGGLRNTTGGTPATVFYDPTFVGRGPMVLSGSATAKVLPPYIEDATKDLFFKPDAAGLITGHFSDEAGTADDTIIPTFVDRYPYPMPILYLRARTGSTMDTTAALSATNNGVVNAAGNKNVRQQYDLDQVFGYTSQPIGMGKKPGTYYSNGSEIAVPTPPTHGLQTVNVSAQISTPGAAAYYLPADGYPYFLNPAIAATPRAKDGYILISAGKDRIYGTLDDITSFGKVVP